MTGLNRSLAEHVEWLLTQFPVVTILGVRQSGKTEFSKSLKPDWKYFDLERIPDYEQISADATFFFERNSEQLILDEAQEYPEIFRVLRGVVDQDRQKKGRFLITGSSSPELLRHVSESLAGRVAIVEMGTLKASERFARPLSSFYDIFTEKLNADNLPNSSAPLTRQELERAWLEGGYPEPVLSGDGALYANWMENYRSTYINRDVAKLFPKLNLVVYQRFLSTLSALSGTIINKASIARAIEVSEPTVNEYLTIAEGTFLWRQLTSFERNVTKSIVKMPKGHMRDSGLLHFLQKINTLDELYASPIVGTSFESFVIEEILKGLQYRGIVNTSYHYYRTRGGAEIDLILDGPFGLLPIEIKYGVSTPRKSLRAIEEFVEFHQCPFGLLINQSDKPEWLTRKIFQLPATWI